MPIIKITNSGYKSPDDMMRLINYVISSERHQTDNLIGGTMILTGTPQYIYTQMMDIKMQYRKANGRFMRQIIVSLSDYEMEFISPPMLYMIAVEICSLFPGYQTLFAIHQETARLHVHFAVNTVSFITGLKIQIKLSELRSAINNIFSRYVPPIQLNGLSSHQPTIVTFDEFFQELEASGQ